MLESKRRPKTFWPFRKHDTAVRIEENLFNALIEPVGRSAARPMNANEPAGPCVEVLLGPPGEEVSDVPPTQAMPFLLRKESDIALIVQPHELVGRLISVLLFGGAGRKDEAYSAKALRIGDYRAQQ